jgi:hypothetical protein
MSIEILIERENWMINSIVNGLGDKMAPRGTPLVVVDFKLTFLT